MYLVKTPVLVSKLLSNSLIWNIPTNDKKLYITFDDGPIPSLSGEILSILDDYQAKATFFCVGQNVERYPELFHLIREKGHIPGNHSHQHVNGWKSKVSDYITNVNQADYFIRSRLFRPPYGQITYQQIKALKTDYKIIMWSVLSGDFDRNLSKEQCFFNVLQSKAGDIVVFHDNEKSREKVLYALPRFLDHFAQKGYSFEHLGLLLND